MTASTDHAILLELEKALRALGASEVLVFRSSAMSTAALYEEMQKLGAPPKLLGVIGSWGDGLAEADVLELLRGWNETGDIHLH